MTSKQQVQKEVTELNKFIRKSGATFAVCGACNGSGKRYEAVYGDPRLGYEYVGRCTTCNGTGKNFKLRIGV